MLSAHTRHPGGLILIDEPSFFVLKIKEKKENKMKNKFKKALVLLMAAVMFVSSGNLQAFAADGEDDEISITSEESVIIPEENDMELTFDEVEVVTEVQEGEEASADEEIAADEIEPVQEEAAQEENEGNNDADQNAESVEESVETELSEVEEPVSTETAEESTSVFYEESDQETEAKVEAETGEEAVESSVGMPEESVGSSDEPVIDEAAEENTPDEQATETEEEQKLTEDLEEADTSEELEPPVAEGSEANAEELSADKDENAESVEAEKGTETDNADEITDDPKQNAEEPEEEPVPALEDKVVVPDPFVPLEAYYDSSFGGQMKYPLTEDAVITCWFGQLDDVHANPHAGIDLAVELGSPVLAAKAGTIVTAHMWDGTMADGYGNYVDIDHGDGLVTRYAHLSEINIQEGDEVSEGQQIGRVGSTGHSTGPHLHFEIIKDGAEVDPYYWIYPVVINIDMNYNFGTIKVLADDEEHRIYQENTASMYRKAGSGEVVYPEDGHVLVMKNAKDLRIDAYDAFGYAISIKAFDSEGNEIILQQDEDGNCVISTDGSVSRVLVGNEVASGRMMLKARGTNAVYTDGMDLNSNAVLQFAQSVGFDVSSFLSSGYAWQVVGGTADGLYSTAEGQAMMSGSIPYTDGGAIGSPTANEVWPGINLWICAGNWDSFNSYLHSGGYPGVQCAGLVNSFFGYIHENLYSDADWKAYYDAYSYGTKNNLSGTFDSWNNVGSVEAGLEGLNSYKEANGYYVQVCDNYSMNHDDFVAFLDQMAPGAVIRFSNNQAGIYDGQGNYRLQHAGIYIGKANGLHWMFHTNTYGMKARIVPLEYYSMSFNNGSEDPHKGRVWITRAGGMEIPDKKGFLEIIKNSSNPSLVSGNTNYSLAGAVYAVYSGDTEVGRLTTGADGKTSSLELDAGTYTIKEITAPKGYLLDTTVYTIEVKPGETNSKGVVDEPDSGSLYLKKESSNTAVTSGNKNYSPKGAEFTVYTDAACTKVVSGATDKDTGAAITKLIVKDDNGNTNTMKLPVAGTYYVKETKAPADGSYEISSEVKAVTVKVGEIASISFKDKPRTSELSLTKSSSLTTVTTGNSCYSLKDTEYTIYRTKSGNTLSDPWPTKLVVQDETGKTNVVNDLPAGTYYVKETKPGKGYLEDPNIYTVILKPGDSKSLAMTDAPMNDPNVICLYKRNGTGGENDLGGAQFKFEFYAAYYDSITEARKHVPTRTWVFETKKDSKGRFLAMYSPDHLVSGDELYMFGNNVGLPLGTIIISEVKAAPGYNNDPIFTNKVSTVSYGSTFFGQIKAVGNVGALYTGNTKLQEDGFDVTDTPIRGNFTIKKTTSNGTAFAGVPFRITMLDENGNKKTGDAYTATFKTGADGSFTSDGSNLWIGTDTKDSSKGSLPYGGYLIEELSDEVNAGYEIISPEKITITVNGQTVDAGTFKNFKPEVTTSLKAANGLQIEEAKKNVTLTDTITYKDFDNYVGKTITIKGEIRKMDGTSVTSKMVTLKLTEANGTLQNVFTFDASDLAGETVVCYEYVSYGDKQVVSHADKNDQAQQVRFPKVGTTAKNDQTDDHLMLADKKAIIVDTVSYSNLIPGKTYTVEGKLMDRTTGNALLVDGKEVTSSAIFKAEKASGSVEMVFSFDASNLAGHSLVVFEDLLIDGKVIGRHEVITDEGQTIHVPDGGTTATDSATNDHIAFADKEVTIKDQVRYENLLPGKEYTVIGKLMDKDTGKALLVGGKEVTASRTFIAENANGSVELSFTFDGSLLENKTVVAFETIQYKGKDVFIHADLKDEDQTVHFPKIRTQARDSITDRELANCAGRITLIDTVSYSNVIPGKTYTLKAVLIDKETNSPIVIGDKKITGTATFTAEAAEGKADVKINFNAESLQGRDLVFFEELYLEDEIVAEHKDITDTDQTIKVPDIQTLAKDENGNKTIPDHGQVTVIDEVQYKNLVPGRKYRLRCVIMLRSTGTEAETQDQYIIDEKNFIPEETDGTTQIRAIIPVTEDFVGEAMVVYEYLTWNDTKIAMHTDLADEGQTVRVPVIGTTALDAETGDHITLAAENAKIVDTVSYKNVTPNEAFTLVGTLMNKATGRPVTDKEGLPVTASALVIPKAEDGNVEMEFTFDASSLKGADVVVFEEMYVGDILVTKHADLEDEGQTIHIPDGGTTAADSKTQDHVAMISEETTIKDTVTYKNLLPGKEYTLIGVLMDKETGEPLLVDGKEVTATKVFTADQKDGSEEIEFTFDSSLLAGKSIVAFETVQYEGKDVFIHADLEDDEQTVRFPWIGTEALDSKTDDHLMLAEKEAKVIDRVSFKNLQPGKEYQMEAIFMDLETGEKIGYGSTVKMIPEVSDGFIDVEIEFDASVLAGRTFVIFEQCLLDGEVVAVHEDLTDEKQTIHVPEIGTKAKDSKTDDHIALADQKMELTDTVSYHNLIPGKEYKVVGKLMDKDLNAPLLIEGKEVVSETVFTPEYTDGEVEMKFVFDGSGLKDKTLVVFEEVFYQENLVAVHADIKDEGQTVHIPDGETHATEKKSGDHLAKSGEVTLIDKVEYRNLLVGKKYSVEGTLMVKETGKQLLDAKGEPVKAEAEFIAEKAEGSIDLTFTFDASLLEGQTVVAFEEVKYGKVTIFVHKYLEDEEQSVHIPKIRTAAKDRKNGTQMILAEETIQLVDTVSYENLIPDQEYILKGVVMDKETGEQLKGSEEVTMTFIPEKADGSVEMIFELKGENLEGKTLVIFEKLYLKDHEVASHENLDDEGQTVYVPEVRTTASDGKTGNHTSLAEEKVQIKDVVRYRNLIPGKEYTVIGTLMDKNTDEMLEVNGEPVMTAVTFTAEQTDGEIEMIFELDGSALEGKTVVAFEDIFYEGTRVGSHADLTDEEQSIHFPEVHTMATANGQKWLNMSLGLVTVTDTVSFKNLIPGVEYTLQAVLMDKQTGKPAMLNGQEVRAEVRFTPDQSDGTVSVQMQVNLEDYAEHDLVVFEMLLQTDIQKIVGRHEDLNDADQTIHVTKHPNTGDVSNPIAWAAVLLLSFGILALCIYQEKKNRLKH